MSNLGEDITASITAAVNARVEAEMLRAFSGDEVFAQFVSRALRQSVEVPRLDGRYGTEKVPFLSDVLYKSIQEATRKAVVRWIEQETANIEAEVRKQLKAQAPAIAKGLVDQLGGVAIDASKYAHVIKVIFQKKGDD
jgi:hypothetical protein